MHRQEKREETQGGFRAGDPSITRHTFFQRLKRKNKLIRAASSSQPNICFGGLGNKCTPNTLYMIKQPNLPSAKAKIIICSHPAVEDSASKSQPISISEPDRQLYSHIIFALHHFFP